MLRWMMRRMLGVWLVAIIGLIAWRFGVAAIPAPLMLQLDIRDDGTAHTFHVDMRTGLLVRDHRDGNADDPLPLYQLTNEYDDNILVRSLVDNTTGDTIELARYPRPFNTLHQTFWSAERDIVWVTSDTADGTGTIITGFDGVTGTQRIQHSHEFIAGDWSQSPDGEWLLLTGRFERIDVPPFQIQPVLLVHLRSGEAIDLPDYDVSSFEWSPNGAWLFTIVYDDALPSGHVRLQWIHPATGDAVSFSAAIAGLLHEWSPTDERVVIGILYAGSQMRDVLLVDLPSREILQLLNTETRVTPIWSTTGDNLVIIGRTQPATVHTVDMDSGDLTYIGDLQHGAAHLALSDRNSLAYHIREFDGTSLTIWHLGTNRQQTLSLPERVTDLRWLAPVAIPEE